MLKNSYLALVVLLLSGCASHAPKMYFQADPVREKINYIRPPAVQNKYHLLMGNDPSMEKAFSYYIKTGKASNIVTSGFVKFAYNGDQQPIVLTNPLQETVISLEPGERFTNVTTGDPSRWSYSAAVSGSGPSKQFNILVKPSLPKLATNMVITTDKRIYNLRLIATEDGKLTRNVKFWYPEEMVAALNAESQNSMEEQTVAQTPDVNLNNMNFDYALSTKGIFWPFPSWKPTRVFDDGKHTFIQFPDLMNNRDMPVLFIESNGEKQLVNYRTKAPYFIVDKIFKVGVLIIGAGKNQEQVVITNNKYN